MKNPDGTYGLWDYIPQDSEFCSKKLAQLSQANNGGGGGCCEKKSMLNNPFTFKKSKDCDSDSQDQSWIHPRRLTGRLRFTKPKRVVGDMQAMQGKGQLSYMGAAEEDSNEVVTCGKQFKDYCASTSLHGYRYLSEPKRTYAERIFWMGWCIFGIVSACYMMSKIWSKWAKNPVLTSVATTNYPVTNVIFPAVTICTVNKAVTEKLIIQGCRYNYTLSQMKTIISMLVDPDARNNDHFNSEKIHVKPETALKYLRLVSPKCDDYLLTCRWNSAPVSCQHIFRLTLTGPAKLDF